MKAWSNAYEENHCEEKTSGHEHREEEEPSWFEENTGKGCHPTRMSMASSEFEQMKFAPAPPMMKQRVFGGRT